MASLEAAARSLDAGRAAEARVALEAAAKERPTQARVWALLARTYHQMQDPEKARQAASRAEQLAGDPIAQHNLALYHAQTGNRKRAAELERLYALSPEADAAAAARAALLSHEVGLYRECIEMGERALPRFSRPELHKALASCYHAQSESLLRTEQVTAAVSLLEAGAARYPEDPQLMLNLGVGYYAQRRFDDAITRFLRVIELAPGIAQPYWFLSRMLDQAGERLGAILTAAEAWNAADREHHLAPFVYAKALVFAGGKAEQAGALFEESLRRKPDYWETHFEYGLLLEQQGQLKRAGQELAKAIELEPKQAAPYYRLARIEERLGNKARAAELRKIHSGMQR